MAKQITYTIDIDGEQRVLKTLADITKASRDIGKSLSTAPIGGAVFQNMQRTQVELQKIKVAAVTTGAALKQVTGTTNQAGVAMQNMNFVIRDSPYFFKDLQLGVLAVGNNINPLIDSFIRLKKEAKAITLETGKVTTSFSLLKKSMMGGMGLSLAMSVLVTAFQAVVFSMGNAARESKKLEEQVKEEENAVSRLRSEWQGLVKDRDIMSKKAFETDPGRLISLHEEKKQLEANLKFYHKRFETESLSETKIDQINQDIVAEEKLLKRVNDEIGFIVFAWQKVVDVQEKSKKQTKEIRLEYQQFNTALEYMNYLMGLQGDIRGDLIRQRQAEMESWENLAEAQDTAADKHKEVKKDMKIITTVSNQLGQALTTAFMTGEFAIDRFIKAVLAAIAQMLILKWITAFLFPPSLLGGVANAVGGGGMAGGAGVRLPIGPAGFQGGLSPSQFAPPMNNQTQTVIIQGKITAEKNRFVADIENATKSYNNNKRFIRVGR